MSDFNVRTATTAELVAFYNTHASAPIKRFADRKTAERRCLELQATAAFLNAHPAPAPAAAPTPAAYVPGTCPACGSSSDITCGTVVERHGRQDVVREHEAMCHACGHEFNYNTGRPLRARAEPGRRATGPRPALSASLKLDRTVTCLDTGESWKNPFRMWRERPTWLSSSQVDTLTGRLYAAAKLGRREVVTLNGRQFALVNVNTGE